ncbi:aspartic peptidase domain-containing protein [Xylaria digitata]|nr:aspartic peptidase domain-containing protein [Xylaria digitata]
MRISQVFGRLRPRGESNPASYHLLENEIDHLEQEKDAEISYFDLEPHISSAGTSTPRKQSSFLRWLRILKVLVPSFLQTSTGQVEPKKKRPTAWLDGLRGVAALFVVLHHMSLIWFSWDIHNGWADWDDHLIQLPIIRLAISGPPNVMVFFVISGCALSWKSLNLIQKGEYLEMYQALASSIFRRHSRLFIPAIVICAPAPVIAYLGGYSGEGMPGAAIRPMNPPRSETIWGQFGNYIGSIMPLSDIYGPPYNIAWVYSDSLWTLPIEFKSSLVVFSMLLALSRCTTRARILITLCVACYSFWYVHWGEFLFVGGMLIVESNLRCQRQASVRELRLNEGDDDSFEAKPNRSPWPRVLRSQAFRRCCSTAAFLTALFILSMPKHDRRAADSYGFKTLVWLIPTHFSAIGAGDSFWQPLAAVFLVLAIDNAKLLQRIFTTRLAQYLGRVSFALYLVHMLILHSLGFWLGKYFVRLTGSESYWQYGTGIGLAAVIIGFVIMCAADLGSRFVDTNTRPRYLLVRLHLVVESSQTWSQEVCGYEAVPKYDPLASSTFLEVKNQTFGVSYGAGIALGTIGTEKVKLGDLAVHDQIIGAADRITVPGDGISSGILGLGYPILTSAHPGESVANDSISLLTNKVFYDPLLLRMRKQGLIPSWFSLTLDRLPRGQSIGNRGLFGLGALPDVKISGPFIATPVEITDGIPAELTNGKISEWTLTVEGVTWSAGNSSRTANVNVTRFQTVVDSGNFFSQLLREIAGQVNAAFIPPAVYDAATESYAVSCRAVAPSFGITIAGTTVSQSSNDMIFQLPSGSRMSTIKRSAASEGIALNFLGGSWLQNVVAVFDIGKDEMRFAPRVTVPISSSIPPTSPAGRPESPRLVVSGALVFLVWGVDFLAFIG